MSVVEPTARFAVVTCADGQMLPAACCALLSASANVSDPARSMLVALDLSAAESAAIDDFSRRHALDIEVIAFESAGLPAVEKGRWPKSVLTRLFLNEILPDGIGRLLYLDADTLAVDSLDALRSVDLSRESVAAVDDYIMAFPAKLQARRTALGLAADACYFNSGVILFDWQNPRARDTLRVARQKLAEFSSHYHATDQDALNAALNGEWARLDPRWNTQTGFIHDVPAPAIVHFTGRRKPWQKDVAWEHRPYSRYYCSKLRGTVWEGIYGTPGRAASITGLALHAAKQLEGFGKARKVSAYLEKRRAQGSCESVR